MKKEEKTISRASRWTVDYKVTRNGHLDAYLSNLTLENGKLKVDLYM